jgi:hypothetical protein
VGRAPAHSNRRARSPNTSQSLARPSIRRRLVVRLDLRGFLQSPAPWASRPRLSCPSRASDLRSRARFISASVCSRSSPASARGESRTHMVRSRPFSAIRPRRCCGVGPRTGVVLVVAIPRRVRRRQSHRNESGSTCQTIRMGVQRARLWTARARGRPPRTALAVGRHNSRARPVARDPGRPRRARLCGEGNRARVRAAIQRATQRRTRRA